MRFPPYCERDPNKTRLSGAKYCSRNTDCFQLKVPSNYSILQAYNCDRQKPGKKTERMPAEKQLYKPDYVKHHFIHYSTVTLNSILNREDTKTVMNLRFKDKPFPDPLSRFGDEVNEGKARRIELINIFVECPPCQKIVKAQYSNNCSWFPCRIKQHLCYIRKLSQLKIQSFGNRLVMPHTMGKHFADWVRRSQTT